MNEIKLLSNDEVNRLLQENNEDIQYVKNLTASRLKGTKIPYNTIELLIDVANDVFVDGYTIDYGDRIVWGQGEHRKYYRGENRDYGLTLTSLGRRLKDLNSDDSLVEECIEKMRIKIFSDFLERTLPVKYYKCGLLSLGYKNITENKVRPFYDAIAQHYGFHTNLLDITSDMYVALFFACCRYENNRWRPLTEEECNKNKYSVLYIANADSIYFANAINKKPILVPVGYQPFMRCEAQNSYVLPLNNCKDLSSVTAFKKYYIEHTPQDCINIYNYMGQGSKIFPNEGLTELFSNEINDMRELTSFPDETYTIIYEKFYKDKIEDSKLRSILENRNIEIYDGSLRNKISRQRIHRLDLKYESLLRNDNKAIFTRKTFMGS